MPHVGRMKQDVCGFCNHKKIKPCLGRNNVVLRYLAYAGSCNNSLIYVSVGVPRSEREIRALQFTLCRGICQDLFCPTTTNHDNGKIRHVLIMWATESGFINYHSEHVMPRHSSQNVVTRLINDTSLNRSVATSWSRLSPKSTKSKFGIIPQIRLLLVCDDL